jgi:hypothetical protein
LQQCSRHILQQVDSTFSTIRQRLVQYNSSSVSAQKYGVRNNTGRTLNVSETLRVTMAFRRARISSLSSKMSSCQGVSFQSISHRGNVGPDGDESDSCALEDPRSFGAYSIWDQSLTRSSSAPPGITLIGSMSMIGEEVDAPTSPTAPCALAPTPGGGVVVLASAVGSGVAVLESAAGGRVTVLTSSASVCAATP